MAVTGRCIDGDTIEVRISEVLDPHQGVKPENTKIRFAGVDTEETKVDEATDKHEEVEGMTQAEYEGTEYYQRAIESKALVRDLTQEKKLYLDIDDLAGDRDPYRGHYGRLIAVVYVKQDGNWTNVNAEVLQDGFPDHVGITAFESEFSPSNWLEESYPYA